MEYFTIWSDSQVSITKSMLTIHFFNQVFQKVAESDLLETVAAAFFFFAFQPSYGVFTVSLPNICFVLNTVDYFQQHFGKAVAEPG